MVAFWNYFQYGMDFLISPEGDVQKILLHSNIVSPSPLSSPIDRETDDD